MSVPKKPRVLVVDDETNVRILVGRILQRECDVDTARNAIEAIELTDQNEYDAVISDYDMPGPDGIALLRQIEETSPRSLRVLHTGKAADDVSNHIRDGVVQNYIPKPARAADFDVVSKQRDTRPPDEPDSTAKAPEQA